MGVVSSTWHNCSFKSAGVWLSWVHQVLWCALHKLPWRGWDGWKLCVHAWGRPWHYVEASGLANRFRRSPAIPPPDCLLPHSCKLWIWVLLAFLPAWVLSFFCPFKIGSCPHHSPCGIQKPKGSNMAVGGCTCHGDTWCAFYGSSGDDNLCKFFLHSHVGHQVC